MRTQPLSVECGDHAAQLVPHIKETQSGHPNLPRELPFIHTSLHPPALIHHSSVISHKAMGGSRSQAQLWLLVWMTHEREREQERIRSPHPSRYICSATTFSSPVLKFSSQARPPSLLLSCHLHLLPFHRKEKLQAWLQITREAT